MNKSLLKAGYCALLALFSIWGLTACGQDTPTGGGGLTPYVVVVTPTPDPANPVQSQLSAISQSPVSAKTAAANSTTTSSTTVNSVPTVTPVGLAGNVYTVQKGDTLLAIANKFGVDVQSIIKLNNITDADSLQIDQKLQIPPPKPKAFTPTPAS